MILELLGKVDFILSEVFLIYYLPFENLLSALFHVVYQLEVCTFSSMPADIIHPVISCFCGFAP